MSNKLLNILLVEDDPDDALIIQKGLLRAFKENIALAHAKNLSRALTLISEIEYTNLDLILLDVNLPDANGLDGLNAIAKSVHGVVPIIMLTGQSDADLALKSIKTHAQDYLPKHDLQGKALFRAIQFGLARHEKTIKTDMRVSMLEAELTEFQARKAKLEHQARELEKIALTLIDRKTG